MKTWGVLAALSLLLIAPASAHEVVAVISPSGLDFLERELVALGPVRLALPEVTLEVQACPGGGGTTLTQRGTEVTLSIDTVVLDTSVAGRLRADLTLSVEARGTAHLDGPYACTGAATCSDRLAIRGGRAIVDLATGMDDGVPRLALERVDLVMGPEDIELELDGCAIDAIANVAAGVARAWFLDQVLATVEAAAIDQLAPRLAELIEAVSAMNGTLGIASFSAAFLGVEASPAGLRVLAEVDVSSRFPPRSCISRDPGDPATHHGALPDLSSGEGHLGVAINLGLADELLYYVWRDGLLCLTEEHLRALGVPLDLSQVAQLVPGIPSGAEVKMELHLDVPPRLEAAADAPDGAGLAVVIEGAALRLVARAPSETEPVVDLQAGLDVRAAASVRIDPVTNALVLGVEGVEIRRLVLEDAAGTLDLDAARIGDLAERQILPGLLRALEGLQLTGPVFSYPGLALVLRRLGTSAGHVFARADLFKAPTDDRGAPDTEAESWPSSAVAPGRTAFRVRGADPEIPAELLRYQVTVDGVAREPTPVKDVRIGELGKTARYHVEVRAMDLAGNLDPTPVAGEVTVDGIAPTLRLRSRRADDVTSDGVLLAWEGGDDTTAPDELGARIDVFRVKDPRNLYDAEREGELELAPGTTQAPVELGSPGLYRVVLHVSDAAGNETSLTALYTVQGAASGCHAGRGPATAPLALLLVLSILLRRRLVILALTLAACGPSSAPRDHVRTRLDQREVRAGQRVTVTCEAVTAAGAVEILPAAPVETDPPLPTDTGRGWVRPSRSGRFEVRCVSERDLPVEPAELAVEPDVLARTRAEVSPARVEAGQVVRVGCQGADRFGNTIHDVDTTLDVTPTDGVTVRGHELVATTAGDRRVKCIAVDAPVQEAATLVVVPGRASRLSLALTPAREVYAPGDQVTIGVQAADLHGNAPEVTVELGVSDPALARLTPPSLTFLQNGTLTITARVTSPTHDGARLEETLTARVDGTPPALILASPPRGVMLTGSPDIEISGTLTDAPTGVASLEINGRDVPFGPDGSFRTRMTARHGTNLIHLAARDAGGNVARHVRAFHWAQAYRAQGATADDSRVPGGIVARLGQAVIDDDEPDVDDLGRIVELVMQGLDFDAFIPRPLVSGGDLAGSCNGYEGTAQSPTFAMPVVDVTLRDGGLHVRLEVTSFRVDVSAQGELACVDIGPVVGNATASRIAIEADVLLGIVSGAARATVTNTEVTVEGLRLDLDTSALGRIVTGLGNLFSEAIAGFVSSALESALTEKVPPVMKQLLSGFGFEREITLPAPLQGRLGVFGGLDALAFSPGEGLLVLDTAFRAPLGVPSGLLGALVSPDSEAPALPPGQPAAMALSLDALNQLLYAAWRSGALRIEVASGLPALQGITVERIRADALLPPVLVAASSGELPFEVQLGDLHVVMAARAGGTPVELEAYVSAIAPAGLSVTGDRVSLQLGAMAQVGVELTRLPDVGVPPSELARSLGETLPMLLPALTTSVIGELPLPAFDLGALGVPGIGPGTRLGLRGVELTYGRKHVYVAGALEPR